MATSSHFITLTYSNENVPILGSSGLLTLQPNDVRDFWKRLRFMQNGSCASPIKYYCVGEYGGKTHRPHYHALVFNCDIELVQDAWGLGEIHVGTVSGASVGYTLKYMCKSKRAMRHWYNGRYPEFSRMSKGLGISYINEVSAEWHAADLVNRMYCTLAGGVKVAMPRYYKEKLYFEAEKAAISEAYRIINHDKQLEKIMRQTTRDVRNEQQAIDAAYDKMYLKAQKNVL